jgi:short-subunit dehydrogenase
MQLSGAVALVTGASSGIGAATAKALAAEGAKLLVTGRDEAGLAAVADTTGAIALPADLAAADGPDRLAQAALAAAGGIDLLVSNAGTGWAGPIEQITAAKVDELLTVNLAAPIQLTRLLAPGMAERGPGRIAFISSISGAVGVRGEAVYAATKAGLDCFAESLRYELADRGVGVTVIVPAVVDTPFFARRGSPYDRRRPVPIPSERIARALISALRRDRDVVFVPRWMEFPARLHGAAPGVFRALAGRFG